MAKKSYITEKIQTLTDINEIYRYLNSLKRDLSEIIKVLRFNKFDFVDDYLYKRKNFKICRCCFEFIKEPCDKPECLKFYESKKLKTREAIIEGNKKRDYKKEVEKRHMTISQDPDYYNKVVSKRAATKLERYGDSKYNNTEAIKEAHHNLDYEAIDLKRRETNNERYGCDYTFEIPEHRERIKATNKERYGYENPMQNPDIKAKAKATNKERYGYENPMQNPDIKAKAKATNKERYGYDWIFQSPEYQESFKLIYILDHLKLPKIKIKQRNTSVIKDLYDKLKTLDINIKLLESDDLDIFIPCINLGINYISFNNLDSVGSNYNLKITKKYKALGVDVFHIFESDNIDLWVSMIKNKLHKNIKIPARNCVVKQINNKDLKDFLDLNHLQGYCNAVIAYGLYKDSDLVACMTFSKPRFNKAYQYELIRFCVKQGITIQGGASKLFKAFLVDYKPISVISYANRRFSKGSIYETLGFKLMRETYPNYYYINESNVYARQKFQKHKLKELFDKNIIKYYNESETESVIMSKNGFSKVYDAGNLTYILNLDLDLNLSS
ncbi:hypothetical protein ACEB11_001775 [Campylobacter coli]